MDTFSIKMIRFVEQMTTGNDWSEDTECKGSDAPFLAPQEVQDLMYFGFMAGDAAEKIEAGDLSPLGGGTPPCADISVLAAVAANRALIWKSLDDQVSRASAPIIASLGTPELAATWQGHDLDYHEAVTAVAYIATMTIARELIMDVVMKAMLLSLTLPSDKLTEQVSFLVPYLDDKGVSFMTNNERRYRQHAILIAISVVEDWEDIDDHWRAAAIKALRAIDIDSDHVLTEENRAIAKTVQDTHWEEVSPKSVASFAAWLTAICRYTKFQNEMELFFVDLADTWEAEDHQEDTVASPDGLAA